MTTSAAPPAHRNDDPPTWDLTDLFDGPDDRELLAVIEGTLGHAQAYATRWKGRIADLDAPRLAAAITEYEQLVLPVRRASTYANLRVTTNGDDPARQALAARLAEVTAAAQQEVLFLELELLALPDDRVATLLQEPALAGHRHYLTTLRRQRDHVLSEAEERILTALGPTGPAAWQRLFANMSSTIQVPRPDGPPRPLEHATADLQSPDRRVRDTATEGISMALMGELRIRASIYDTLVQDHAIRDGLRGHDSWLHVRNLANEVSDTQVRTLVDAVTGRYDLVGRWYRLKARLMGVDTLAEHDRYAPLPLGDAPQRFGWDEARALVTAAYADFSPVAAEIVEMHFEEGWIDAVPGEHKQPGAFCVAVPGQHPWINLSFTGTDNDVMTLAHELGHGIHGFLQRDVVQSSFDVPLTMAETASVFGETVTHRRLEAASTDEATTLRLLARRIDGEIATIFRQVAMFRFEDEVHTRRRTSGQLSVEDLNGIWMSTQREMFDGAVRLGDRYAHWWSYVPHFVHSPGYVYAYAFGNLLSFALLERWQADGDGFVNAYLTMLSKGGSESPEDLLAPLGVDLADPEFWQSGLAVLEGLIARAERLADTVVPTAAPGTGPSAGAVSGR